MSTYQELKSLKVKYLSSDTSGDRAIEGEVFYNSVSGKVASHIAVGAFSSGPSTIESFSYNSGSLQGTQTAAIIAGSGPASPRTKAESYNGSGFSVEPDLNNGRGSGECGGGAGTATAALCYNGTPGGGPILNYIEEYNGTSWSEQSDLNTGRVQVSGAGIETAALVFSGQTAGGATAHNETEEYNGSSWSEQSNLSTSRRNAGGGGIQTSAICIGGVSGSTVYNNIEEYDGSSWTAGTNYPTNIRGASIIASTSSDALALGGNNPPSSIPAVGVRKYDGTTWTSVADLASSKQNACGIGTTSAGLSIGNNGSAGIGGVEEWNVSTSAITAAAWASGGNLNQGRYWLGTANQGTQNASMGFGGYLTPGNTMYALTEQYDGSSWTEVGDLVLARSQMSGAGTNTAGLCIGGYVNAVGTKAETEEFDGTSWSEQGNLGTARYASGGAGTQTAGLCMSGVFYIAGQGPSQSYKTETEEYDGSSWTESGDVSTARSRVGGCGTQTAALMCGGYTPSLQTATEEYNGSSWTTGGALFTATGQLLRQVVKQQHQLLVEQRDQMWQQHLDMMDLHGQHNQVQEQQDVVQLELDQHLQVQHLEVQLTKQTQKNLQVKQHL